MDTLSDCVNGLWSDLREDEHFPAVRPLLAHYTSLSTMESIFRGEEIWMSHPFLMNDDEELKWGIVEGVKRIRTNEHLARGFGSASNYAGFLEAVESAKDKEGGTNALDTYVACFCQHEKNDKDGLLSMWRAYGADGGGVAIVFDTSALVEDDQSPLIIAPVRYATTEERYAWIDRALNICSKAVAAFGSSANHVNIGHIAYAYFQRLRYFALFTKHVAFREENEWRVVYFPDRDEKQRYAELLSYAITQKGIQPKLKLRLGLNAIGGPLLLEDAVSSILLGPTAGSLLSAHALKRMLRNLGKPGLADKIGFSSTPYRP
ncbi:DUF2971 domain-containing protein [Salmonella enterica subsp. enterica]|uniref:DUF2971 domain-containing protein n=1 Tax=Stenotrophomonas pavanii TaxID=487698 RepID=A0ABM7RCR8_9GAMM|nr:MULTISPECIES: DUF2971 domain-containing protein [Stenotrophomonas]EAB7134012.1 DUF2971 domain-containing protein [Salmonella enterica subsp. enterica serovar Enteritidis]MBH1387602.1 DUF2971 domain-containing protein [Stenotrophomonas maltophilia]UGB18922.1 DUF2971 domain-containing protein [Stenotrophomonas maltophilia]UGB49844.1 DUF2971 domain-containing protein [Stenotrophomonas maltophilia]BCX45740.1 DUF2971 domain-containing protein [Stenotrophomonas pavanii]